MDGNERNRKKEWSVDGQVRSLSADGSVSAEKVAINNLFAPDAAAAAAEALDFYAALLQTKGIEVTRVEWASGPKVRASDWFDR